MINFLKNIESNYNVNDIKVNGAPIWGVLRTSFYVRYGNKYNGMIWSSQKAKRISYFKTLKSIFFSFFYLFKNYNYFFLSESNERKLIDGKQYDKLCDGIIDLFGKKKCLISELPVNGNFFHKKNIHTKNFITSLLFYYIAKIIPKPNYTIDGEDTIHRILKKYELEIDYKKTILLFLKYQKIAIFFLKIWKPKAIFVKCYYSPLNQGFISAANSLNIKTIELQHGLISESHPSYNIFTNLEKNTLPQWILTNGFFEKNILIKTENKIYKKVIPVGNYYLEKIEKNNLISTELKKIKKDFNRIIAITLQDTVEDMTISFIKKVAAIDNKNLYLIIPRNFSEKYKSLKENDNILIDEKFKFYDIISHVDFHSTVYSTCAIESVYFGISNILLDFDDKSSHYFSSILEVGNFNHYIKSTSQFLNSVNRPNIPSKKDVKEAHKYICKADYKNNIKNIRKLILNN
jgi:hypothetical protein